MECCLLATAAAGPLPATAKCFLLNTGLQVYFVPLDSLRGRLPHTGPASPTPRAGDNPSVGSRTETLPALGLTCQNHWICLLFLV